MSEFNCSGKITLSVDENGNFTNRGHYQNWRATETISFERVSEHAISWRSVDKPTVPPTWLDKAIRKALNIPVIDNTR